MWVPDGLEILAPWRSIAGSGGESESERLTNELRKELSQGHILYGAKLRAVAFRKDRDDVLFEVDNSDHPLVVVHLTWRRESDPRWPTTVFFENWEQWLRGEMLPASEEYDL